MSVVPGEGALQLDCTVLLLLHAVVAPPCYTPQHCMWGLVSQTLSELRCQLHPTSPQCKADLPSSCFADKCSVPAQMAVSALDFYHQWTGVAQPLPKFDLVAVPGKGGLSGGKGVLLMIEACCHCPCWASSESPASCPQICFQLGSRATGLWPQIAQHVRWPALLTRLRQATAPAHSGCWTISRRLGFRVQSGGHSGQACCAAA